MRLFNGKGDAELGVARDSGAQFMVDEGGRGLGYFQGSDEGQYDIWIRVDVEIDWNANRFTARWTPEGSDTTTTFDSGELSHGLPIKEIRWSNADSEGWGHNSNMYMQICGVQYETDTLSTLDIEDQGKWIHRDSNVEAVGPVNGNCPHRDKDGNALNSLVIQSSFSTDAWSVASYIPDEPTRIEYFSFSYYEWRENDGGGIRLLTEEETAVLGIFTFGHALGIEDEQREDPIHEGAVDQIGQSDYDIWIRVDIQISWSNASFEVTWTRVNNNKPIHSYTEGLLKNRSPTKYIGWFNRNSDGWMSSSDLFMKFCAVQYGNESSPCNAGERLNAQCKCGSCPNRAVSDQRSSICTMCSAGRYRTSESQCVDCPEGEVSDEGAESCSQCPAGRYSRGGSKCMDCPFGKTSNGDSASKAACFEPTPTSSVTSTSTSPTPTELSGAPNVSIPSSSPPISNPKHADNEDPNQNSSNDAKNLLSPHRPVKLVTINCEGETKFKRTYRPKRRRG